MPLYKYECDGCRKQQSVELTIEEYTRQKKWGPVTHWIDSEVCGEFQRVFDFHFARSMPEHYSDTLDTVVRSQRHFDDEMKRQSDEASARMGYDIQYEAIDPNDAKAAGVKGDAGLESQERAQHDAASDGHKSVFS